MLFVCHARPSLVCGWPNLRLRHSTIAMLCLLAASVSAWHIKNKERCKGFSVQCSALSLDAMLPALAAFEFLGELRHDSQGVADHAQISRGKDGRVLVAVDGDDVLRAFHACQVLDGSADA